MSWAPIFRSNKQPSVFSRTPKQSQRTVPTPTSLTSPLGVVTHDLSLMCPQEGSATGLDLADSCGEPGHSMQPRPGAQEGTDTTQYYLGKSSGLEPWDQQRKHGGE